MDANIAYVKEHFLPRSDIVGRSGVPSEGIDRLIALQLLPRPCYFPGENGRLTSNLGSTDSLLDTDYFHPTAVDQARDGSALLDANADADALARYLRDRFVASYAARLVLLHELGLIEPGVWNQSFATDDMRRTLAGTEYTHWLAGTYGICTRANTAKAVAIKESMVSNARHLTQEGAGPALDAGSRSRLARYLALYDRTAALFAPFERPGSSRQRLCVEWKARYLG